MDGKQSCVEASAFHHIDNQQMQSFDGPLEGRRVPDIGFAVFLKGAAEKQGRTPAHGRQVVAHIMRHNRQKLFRSDSRPLTVAHRE